MHFTGGESACKVLHPSTHIYKHEEWFIIVKHEPGIKFVTLTFKLHVTIFSKTLGNQTKKYHHLFPW